MNNSGLSLIKENYYLKEKIKELENEINTKQEIIENLFKEEKEKKEKQRSIENDFNTQLLYYKNLHESGMAKATAAESIIKLNEIQHNSIKQLENKIDEIKQTYENTIKDIEIEDENNYTKLKKKMMELLKNSKKEMAISNEENLELNTKVTLLYKNQMLNELASQSSLIEELLKEKEKQKKEIYFLREELKTHKKVEGIIKNKNCKYLNIINKINMNNNQIKDTKDNNVENSNINSEKEEISTKITDNKSSKIIFDNLMSINDYNKEIYKTLFKDIIILLNQAKEKIMTNKKITNISKSNLFTDNFNFNILTSEQKYELLIEIMKVIFMFLNLDIKKDSHIIKIKKKIDLIKINDNNTLSDENHSNTLSLSSPFNGYKTPKLSNHKKKAKNIFNSTIKKRFPKLNNNIKKDVFNQLISSEMSKVNRNRKDSFIISSYRGFSPNPIIRYMNINNDNSRKNDDKKNISFFNSDIKL